MQVLSVAAILALAPALGASGVEDAFAHSSASAAAAACTATGGGFMWGFKESFRAYVSGSIATGEWTTAGGIDYATPAFSTDELTGELNLQTMMGELAVDGSIRFTGHEGILDTTIDNPRLLFDGQDRLVVVVNLIGTTQSFVEVNADAVPFLTGDLQAAQWSAETGALVLDSIALTLTQEGADAFGTYLPGEQFDSMTLTLATGADCATQAIEQRASAQRAPLVVAGLVIAGGVALGAGLAVLWRRRHRLRDRDRDRDRPGAAPSDD